MSKQVDLLLNINDKYIIKLKNEDLDSIGKKISEINEKIEAMNNEIFININYDEYNSIHQYFNVKIDENPITKWVKDHVNNNPNRDKITCLKLSELYSFETGGKIGKTKMSIF